MNNILFEGVYSATFSIYDENMNVKKDSVAKLIKYNEDNGIKGFYVGGNTGECTVLPNKTRKQMLEAVKEYASPNAQIMAHVGAGHLDDVKDLIEHANSVGVDAIASLPPSLMSYYKPDEIVEYYKYIASLTKSPVLAYVTPVLNCDVVWYAKQVMEIENMIGIKLSIADYYTFEKLKRAMDGNINILNGPDEAMICGLAMGADGAIGTTYNLLPATACKIYDNFKAGNIAEAQKYQHKLNQAIDIILGGNIGKWKSVLTAIDIDPGYTVFPAHTYTEAETKELLAKLDEAGVLKEMRG